MRIVPEVTAFTVPESVTTVPDTEETERPAGMPVPVTAIVGTTPKTVPIVMVLTPAAEAAAVVSAPVGPTDDNVANEPKE